MGINEDRNHSEKDAENGTKTRGPDHDAFEKASIPLQLANLFKIKAIAWPSIKNDIVDARTLAHLLRPTWWQNAT